MNQTQLEELVSEITSAIKKLGEISDIQTKVNERKFRNFMEAELQKKIEDGIIANLHNANERQLVRIFDRRSGYFVYYSEIYQYSDPKFVNL